MREDIIPRTLPNANARDGYPLSGIQRRQRIILLSSYRKVPRKERTKMCPSPTLPMTAVYPVYKASAAPTASMNEAEGRS